LRWLEERIDQDQVDVNLLTTLRCIQNLGASVDSHCVWIKAKIFIIVEVEEANEGFILLQLQHVLFGVFVVLLVHYGELMDT